MGIRSSLALPSVCALLTEPTLSEIIVHLTFTPSSLSREIHALRETLSHRKLSDTRIKQSISNTFKIVSRKHELHPWKFINVELNFEGVEEIPLIDETLKEILRQFACNLGLLEVCPVSVGASRFIPDSGSYVHGLVNHDELLHFIPRPRIFNGYLTRQLHPTETSNAIPCSKADEKIAQFTSIGFRLSGIKLHGGCHQLSTSAQEFSSDSASEDGSGEEPNIRPAFFELSGGLNKQSQQQTQQTQQPLKPQRMGAISNGQLSTDYQTMQYQHMWKMQMQANAKHSNYQIPINMTARAKCEPMETTNFSDDSDEGGVSIYIKPTPDCFETVKYWAEQVETERKDTKERHCSYSLQNNTSGTIFEWPWVQMELYGVLKRPAVAENSTLEVDSGSDSEEATSLISECRSHLRGGDLPNRNALKQCLKKITERISRCNFQHDIDLGYGGSNFSAEPFPEYDPTVDLAYLSDSSSIESPSKLSMATHERNKLRTMVEIPLKSIKDKFSCEKFKKPRNREVEDSDKYEDSEGISNKFKRPLETMEKEESEKEKESSEETSRKKENRLDVETIYRLITSSILEAKLAMGMRQKRRDLARIAQSQLSHGSSPDPKPYGPTMIYLTNKTQLRGGSGNEKETSFFTRNRLRLGRLLRNHSESERAIAGPAPPATRNAVPGAETGLQRHHRDDSGVSGMGDEQRRNKDESVENETPRQVVNLSEPGSQTTETVREVDSDTSEETGNAAHSEHVEHVEHVENTENVEDTDSSKPSEPRRAPRKRPERQPEENETHRRFRSELLDILWRFLALKEEIWFKRNAIIHGAPSSKNNFEAHLTADEVDDIRQYVQNSREMIEVSNEPRDAVAFPDLITRANNHLLRARRVRQIFDNWYTREGQQQRQNVPSTNTREESSNVEKSSPVPARGAGVLDNWPFAAAPSVNFRRDRNNSETSTDIPRTSSDTQLLRRRSSLILAPLPNLFQAPYPGQAFRGETRGESSRSGANGGDEGSIAEKIDVLRARNNISPTTSRYENSISSCGTQKGGMPNCHEQNEDHVYQEPISEAIIQRLQDLGASRVETVNLLNATAGDVNRAAEFLQNENPLEQEDMRRMLVDPDNDLHQVVAVTGVPPRRAFLALLVSESDVGGAIDLLTGEAIGATMRDEAISEEDSGNGSSSSGMKRYEEGEECEKSSSEGSDVEVAETDEIFEPLVSEAEDNGGGDECEKSGSEGMNVNAAESDEEYQPLIDKTENNDEDDVHDDEGGIDNDGYDDTDDSEHNRAGEAPVIEVEMVLSSRKGKERAEGYNL